MSGARIPVKVHRRVSLVLVEDETLAEELLARKKLASDVAGRLTPTALLVRPGICGASFFLYLIFCRRIWRWDIATDWHPFWR